MQKLNSYSLASLIMLLAYFLHIPTAHAVDEGVDPGYYGGPEIAPPSSTIVDPGHEYQPHLSWPSAAIPSAQGVGANIFNGELLELDDYTSVRALLDADERTNRRDVNYGHAADNLDFIKGDIILGTRDEDISTYNDKIEIQSLSDSSKNSPSYKDTLAYIKNINENVHGNNNSDTIDKQTWYEYVNNNYSHLNKKDINAMKRQFDTASLYLGQDYDEDQELDTGQLKTAREADLWNFN